MNNLNKNHKKLLETSPSQLTWLQRNLLPYNGMLLKAYLIRYGLLDRYIKGKGMDDERAMY